MLGAEKDGKEKYTHNFCSHVIVSYILPEINKNCKLCQANEGKVNSLEAYCVEACLKNQ